MAANINISVEPLRIEQVDDYVSVQWAAFAPPEADMILPMIYTAGWQPDLHSRLRHRLLKSTNNEPGSVCFCARDADTGEVLGISWWETDLDPPQSRAEIDELYAKAIKVKDGLPPVEGMNEQLGDAFFKVSFYATHELANGQPHVELVLLGTHPKHHRKGVASLLLKHGLEKADSLKLPTCLVSSVSGRALYERFGFEVVSDFPFDARQYGGRSQGKHWCMIRPAKP